MVELKFFRDETNVYFNNPNGITTKKSIEDFERWISGEGGGGGVDYFYPVTVTYDEDTGSYTLDKTYNEILGALDAGKYVIGIGYINGMTGTKWFDGINSVLYIQLLNYRLDNSMPSRPRIDVSGVQISPDGTIEDIMSV